MITHKFVSTNPDDPTVGLIQVSHWNQPLNVSGGGDGQLLVRDSANPDGHIWSSGLKVTGGHLRIGTSTGAIQTDQVLAIGGPDNPGNYLIEIQSANCLIGFKSANGGNNDAFFGHGVSNLGGLAGFRAGSSGFVILQENGGPVVLGPASPTGGAATLSFGGFASVSVPMIRRFNTELRFKASDDSAFTSLRAADVFVNANQGTMLVGGIDADRSYAGLWVGQASPSFSNYTFLGNATGNTTTLFNAPNVAGLIEFRVINGGRATVGNVGLAVNENGGVAPTNPFLVKDTSRTNPLLTVKDNGEIIIGSAANLPTGNSLTVNASGGSDMQFVTTNLRLKRWGGNMAQSFQRANGTISAPTIVANGDLIGGSYWGGWDGAAIQFLAGIDAAVDGVPGANDMPGRLMFYTTPDGTTAIVERMRIDQAGRFGIGTNSPVANVRMTLDSLPGGTVAMRIRNSDTPRYRSDFQIGPVGLSVNAFDDTGVVSMPVRMVGSFHERYAQDALTAFPANFDYFHETSGTPVAGFGLQWRARLNSDTVADQLASAIVTSWTDPANATRTSQLQFQTVNNGGGLTTWMSVSGAGLVKFFAAVQAPALGAFAAGDKYVTIDAAGNLHKSAIGPAS